MSAGSGIRHSEYNFENNKTNIFQIWIEPSKLGVKPRWDSALFPKDPISDSLPLLVSEESDKAPLFIKMLKYMMAICLKIQR